MMLQHEPAMTVSGTCIVERLAVARRWEEFGRGPERHVGIDASSCQARAAQSVCSHALASLLAGHW